MGGGNCPLAKLDLQGRAGSKGSCPRAAGLGPAESPIHLVYPPRRFSFAKVREMLPLLEQSLRKLYL